MFTQIISYLPCEVAAIGFLLGLFIKSANKGKSYLVALLLLLSLFFAIDAFVMFPNMNKSLEVYADLLFRVLATAIVPLFTWFLYASMDMRMPAFMTSILLLPLAVAGVSTLIMIPILGLESVSDFLYNLNLHGLLGSHNLYEVSEFRAFFFVFVLLFDVLIILQIIFITLMLIVGLHRNLFSFKKIPEYIKERRVSSYNMLFIVVLLFILMIGFKILQGRYFFLHHTGMLVFYNLGISVLIASLTTLGLFYAGKQLHFGMVDVDAIIATQPDVYELKRIEIESQQEKDAPAKPSELRRKFDSYFVEGKAFLDPDMSIEKLCADLGTNRTYISVMMNKEIGLPFREYLNKCRIDHAKSLMKCQSGLSLEMVAIKSGFKSASQFSKKFKEEVGVSPVKWAQLPKA